MRGGISNFITSGVHSIERECCYVLTRRILCVFTIKACVFCCSGSSVLLVVKMESEAICLELNVILGIKQYYAIRSRATIVTN